MRLDGFQKHMLTHFSFKDNLSSQILTHALQPRFPVSTLEASSMFAIQNADTL